MKTVPALAEANVRYFPNRTDIPKHRSVPPDQNLPNNVTDLIVWFVDRYDIDDPEEIQEIFQSVRHLTSQREQAAYGNGVDEIFARLIQERSQVDKLKQENQQLLAQIHLLRSRLRELEEKIIWLRGQVSHIGKYFEGKFELLWSQKTLDDLTKLMNLNEFKRQLHKLLQSEQRSFTAAVIEFDISDFKLINDLIGHEMGNLVIRRAAKILKSNMRVQKRAPGRLDYKDIQARLGGDEFGSLVVGLEKEEDALHITARCCRQFDQIDWASQYREWSQALKRNPEVARIRPRFNPGVVIMHSDIFPRIKNMSQGKRLVDSLLKMADKLMYESKAHQKTFWYSDFYYSVVRFDSDNVDVSKLTVLSESSFSPEVAAL